MTYTSTYTPVVQPRMGAFDETDQNLIRYLGLNPNKPEDRAAVTVCRHYGFDPLLKHVVVIPRSGLYITRDGLLSVAHRSGQLDGIVVEKEPALDEQRNEWVARVSVYRKDMTHPFTYPGRYPADGGNKQYAPEMALKAAESHALRRAFDITGLPTLDEQHAPTPAPDPVAPPCEGLPSDILGGATAAEPAEVVDRSDEQVKLFSAEADSDQEDADA